MAIVVAVAGGQDPVGIHRAQAAAYRVAATLDETERLLRGSEEIRYAPPRGQTLTSVELDVGTAHLDLVSASGVALAGRTTTRGTVAIGLPRPPTGADTLVLQVLFTAPAAPPPPTAAADTRRFTFRAWLPRLLASDGPRHPVVGTILLTLDVPADQVVAATGVPLCGDPGWGAARRPPGRPVTLQRDAYAAARDAEARPLPPDACRPASAGRKTIVWYSEDVADAALRMDPAFRYEEGDLLGRPVRVLYRAGEERTWGAGVAVRHSETALAWLDELFEGPAPAGYPWPQTTVVHGLGPRGRVDPMLASVTSPDQGDILRQLGRLYLVAATALAPADDAWLDLGLTRFQTDLYYETQGRRTTYRRLERAVLDEELDGAARSVLDPNGGVPRPDGARARRAEFLFYQLRAAAGDSTLSRILHAYWAHARLRDAGESLFVAVADSVSRGDLGRRFAASLRETAPVDYAVGAVRRTQLPGGHWRTTAVVRRLGAGQFPLEVRVAADSDAASVTASGVAPRETVQIETRTRPRRVVLDPATRSHDWNVLNNRKAFGIHLGRDAPVSDRFDPYFARPSSRDRLVRSWAPTVWYNDAGGWTVGVRRREDYLGRFDLNEQWATLATGAASRVGRTELDGRLVVRNPTWLRSPGLSERLEIGRTEGRTIAALGVKRSWGAGRRTAGAALTWVDATTVRYLDSARYERAGTVELTATGRAAWAGPASRASAALVLTGGAALRRSPPPGTRAREPYARVSAVVEGDRAVGALHLRARAWAGAAIERGRLLRQRRVYLAAADPYEQLGDPFLRSRGALLMRPGFHYHAPGGAGLRALDPALAGRQGYGLSLELEQDLVRRTGGLARRVAVAVFGDGAFGDGDLDPTGSDRLTAAADAGVGLRLDHRIGTTSFQTRFDVPVWVSRPLLAQDTHPGSRRFGFRWLFSFAPAF
jgi:hypothetical protein